MTTGLLTFFRRWQFYTVLLLISMNLTQTVYATSAASGNGAISQGYISSSNNISPGALLSLQTNAKNVVVPANSANSSNIVGIAANKPLVELSENGANNIQVVVGGSTDALVSNINGAVKIGDKITASPISGIGMKAVNSSEIVGTAQENLSSVQTVKRSVSGTNGKNIEISVGLLPIAVNVAYYSASSSQGNVSAFVPMFLQDIANSLTGKQVSPLRVLFGTFALLLGFVAVTLMLYVSIRSDITSIGRNPLAEVALRKGLVDVIIAAMGVLLITIVIVYAVILS
jgi:hypothetical protein